MDIEDFYGADARRREGEDHSYGPAWSEDGDDHHLWDLFYNDGSGELFLVAKPVLNPWVGYVGFALQEDIREIEWIGHRIAGVAEHLIHPRHIQAKTGETSPRHPKDALTEELTVEILAVMPTRAAVDALLQGWQAAMGEKGSLTWLRSRLAEAGVGPA
ncbi:MAG: hypothetical protein NVSMB32_18360 [Actinomycetota bacterium]